MPKKTKGSDLFDKIKNVPTDSLAEAILSKENFSKADAAEIRAMMLQQIDAHSSIRERIASLEEAVKYSATKADVANVKIWALGGIAAALLAAVFALVRLVFYP